ncbi:MAG: NfeD family protein [Kiritimatiellia bacterium]
MDLTAASWVWLYAGAFLMLAELASPGFVIFFFGLGAATVALAKWLFPSLPLSGQLALFSVFSILYLVVLRRLMKRLFMGDTTQIEAIENEYVGRLGTVVAAIRPGVPGRILLGDAEWTAEAETELPVGADVKIVGRKNLVFSVVRIADATPPRG